jgi:hypothetical protein
VGSVNCLRSIATIGRAFLLAALLQSCAAVDQFGGRIEDANRNSQHANDQETLLNIVRAEYYRPLTFVAISQVTGGQTETLTSGLPTITFGSGITPAQHIGQISNSVMSQAQGGYQSNPLVSTAFQSGMLSAIPEATVAYLIAAHPRDPVLFSTIDALIIKVDSTGVVYRLDNNPDEDHLRDEEHPDLDCPALAAKPVDAHFFDRSIPCSYSTFLRVAHFIAQTGLTAEIIPADKSANAPAASGAALASGAGAAKSASGGGSSSDKGTTQPPQGRFCFDPTKSGQGIHEPKCTIFKKQLNSTPKEAKVVRFQFGAVGTIEMQILVKSPLGVYQLFGAVLRHPWPGRFPYASRQGQELVKDEPFVNVTNSPGPCFVDVVYEGQRSCVPAASQNTPVLFDIVQQLKNLSTTPTDLNAPFAVRFIGN